MSLKHWKQHHFDQLKNAATYRELFLIAYDVLLGIPPPVGQVCGPISTGGVGSIKENLARFEKAIDDLQKKNIEIFNQVPFEVPMQRIKSAREGVGEYDTALLNDFYLPIFESKLVHTLFFMPDWRSSVGAQWEHEQARRIGIEIVYLD